MCPQLRVTLLLVLAVMLWLVTWISAQITAPLEKLLSRGPTIVYENGLLTISAHNSTLSDVLKGIARQTGADIDIPPQADELVAVYLGSEAARDVVQSLLSGSRFNYVIVGSNADASRLTKILLLPILAAEKPSDQVVNTAAVQQPSVLRPEGNDIEEAVQFGESAGVSTSYTGAATTNGNAAVAEPIAAVNCSRSSLRVGQFLHKRFTLSAQQWTGGLITGRCDLYHSGMCRRPIVFQMWGTIPLPGAPRPPQDI